MTAASAPSVAPAPEDAAMGVSALSASPPEVVPPAHVPAVELAAASSILESPLDASTCAVSAQLLASPASGVIDVATDTDAVAGVGVATDVIPSDGVMVRTKPAVMTDGGLPATSTSSSPMLLNVELKLCVTRVARVPAASSGKGGVALGMTPPLG